MIVGVVEPHHMNTRSAGLSVPPLGPGVRTGAVLLEDHVCFSPGVAQRSVCGMASMEEEWLPKKALDLAPEGKV